MSKMPRACSYEGYKEIISEVLYKIDEIKAADEFNGDYMNDSMQVAGTLEKPLRELKQQLDDGSYEHSSEGLAFMQNMARIPMEILVFRPLLTRINETHMKGLEDQSDD